MEDLLDPEHVARILKLRSARVLEAWRRNGSGPPFIRVSSRCIRYHRADLDAWINERRVDDDSDPVEVAMRRFMARKAHI